LKTSKTSYSPVADGTFLGEAPNPIALNEGILLPHYVSDYMKFEQGSYWIYKDINSGLLDSVWVVPSLNRDTIYNCQGKKYQYIETVTKSSYFNCRYCYSSWSVGNYYGVSCKKGGGYIITVVRTKLDSLNNYMTKYNPSQFETLNTITLPVAEKLYRSQAFYGKHSEDSVYTEKYISQMNLNHLSYQDVLISVDPFNPFEGEAMQFVFARYVGLIGQHLLASNQNWQLIRYRVIQNGKTTIR
jgi:hypothetical protein